MLKNYLKIAIRNLGKQKVYSSINILGLSIGIASAILIILFASDELNYDKFNHNYERIGRIITQSKGKDNSVRNFSLSGASLGESLAAEYPEVENSTPILDRNSFGRFTVQYENNKYYESGYLVTRPSFLKIFDFKVLRGDKRSLLTEPNEMVLTETTARKLFGDENPIGKIIKTDRSWGDFKVTGLIQDPPKNSHLQFSMLISFKSLEHFSGFSKALQNFDLSLVRTYLLFKDKKDMAGFDKKLTAFESVHKGKAFGVTDHISVQPLSNIHYGSQNIEFDLNYGARNKSTVYILGIIGLLIIIVAGINYTNLAAARSMKRSKEIGIRKVVGAKRGQLISQFLTEAVLLTTISLFIALIVVELVLPYFNSFTGKNISFTENFNLTILASIIFLALLLGLLSGSLPAFFISKLKTIFILKSKVQPDSALKKIGKVLVVIQFAVSIILIFGTITIYKQLQYINEKDIGFNKDHLLVVDINSGGTRYNFQAIKNEIMKNPNVKSISVSSRLPGDWKNITAVNAFKNGKTTNDATEMYYLGIDKDFLNTFQMNLLAGRNFTGQPDSANIIVNEAAAKVLELSDPVGKAINLSGNKSTGQYNVIGVVKDFNFQSLHEKISPMILGFRDNQFTNIDYFTARISSKDIAGTIKYFSDVQQKFDNVTPFEYNFLDERMRDFYEKDQRESIIVEYASGFAIFIACLGLFGLAAFSAEEKTKEIGIRKVLGADVPGIITLLSKEFLWLVVIANIIALPLGYYLMGKWLNNFAYNPGIALSTFLFTMFITIFITFITTSYHSIKASLKNPVESLKYE